MINLPDITKDYVFSLNERIIRTPNFNIRGKLLPEHPEDIMAYYYAGQSVAKRMKIDQNPEAKNVKNDIEKFLDTWGKEAAIYIRTSYEKDAVIIIETIPNVSVADVKGLIYMKYWNNRVEREDVISQVLAPNGKVMLMYKGESVVPDMEP